MQLKKFLLGELPPAERELIEERLFLDSEYFKHFKAAEDDLIDEYLYGDLDTDQRERFEKYFLQEPGRRESLQVASALQNYLSEKKFSARDLEQKPLRPEETSRSGINLFRLLWSRHPKLVPGLSLAAALLLAVAGMWLARAFMQREVPMSRQARQTEVQPSPTAQTSGQDSAAPLPSSTQQIANKNTPVIKTTPQKEVVTAPPRAADENRRRDIQIDRPTTPTYAFMLLPGSSVRGEGDLTHVELPAGRSVATFQLSLLSKTKYLRYRVTLHSEDGQLIKTWAVPKSSSGPGGSVVSVSIPSERLRQQTYKLLLEGVPAEGGFREIATYHFVAKKSEHNVR